MPQIRYSGSSSFKQPRRLHQSPTQEVTVGAASFDDAPADRRLLWAPDEPGLPGRAAASLRKRRARVPPAELAVLTATVRCRAAVARG